MAASGCADEHADEVQERFEYRDVTDRILMPWQNCSSPARSALAVVAGDAVDTLGGLRVGTIKVCAGTDCVAVFLDATRGEFRRWCSMNTCGNRAKKDAMRVRAAQ
ncbi:Zinc finger CGNR domain-containing protein OS=Streptomyces fumanus OX=67302 GN=GCM10018772_25200 PE=4 SV=1 [Streptomyces fumanus]